MLTVIPSKKWQKVKRLQTLRNNKNMNNIGSVKF